MMTESAMALTDVVGLAGVALYLLAYSLLQSGQLRSDECTWSVLNLFAASMVLVSLSTDFNLASALIQVSWILVSLAGLHRLRSTRSRRNRDGASRRRARRRAGRLTVLRGE